MPLAYIERRHYKCRRTGCLLKAESLMIISIGQRPMKRERPKIQALQGRHQGIDYTPAGLARALIRVSSGVARRWWIKGFSLNLHNMGITD